MCEDLVVQKKSVSFALVIEKVTSYHMGKCYTASSFRILQGLIAAKVVSCSSAMCNLGVVGSNPTRGSPRHLPNGQMSF